RGSPFYFDFLTVNTAQENPVGDAIVDDRDLSILYSGTWEPNGAESEYLHTTSQTPKGPNGGTATFTFEGTGIAVYGTTDANARNGGNATHLAFTLDGFTTQYDGIPNSDVMRNVRFFSNQSLPNGRHTLSFTLLDENICYFDYLVYSHDGSGTGGNGSDGSSAGGGGSGGGGGGGGSNSKTNLGGIVGGVVGAITLLILLVLLVVCVIIRSRKQKRTKGKVVKGETQGSTTEL
ncbi:hypothetical protein FRC18_002528, partial [Serendipita sp. 400]